MGFKCIKKNSEPRNCSNLPPIFNNQEQNEINLGILKNLQIDTSFDVGQKPPDRKVHPHTFVSKNYDSTKIISKTNTEIKPYVNKEKAKNTFLPIPTFGSFSQSLGRFSSFQHFQHAHTDRDITEDINEELNESLDNFLLNDQFGKDNLKMSLAKFRRVETENRRLDSNSSKTKLLESSKKYKSN